MKKQLLMGSLAAAMMAGTAVPALADGMSASAAVASTYLFRGLDLGEAAVSGSLGYSMAGAYGNVWASSGDTTFGNEYDLTAGYATKVGGVGLDVGVVNYNYSQLGGNADTSGDLTEVFAKVSFMGATFSYFDNVASADALEGSDGYEYYSLSYSMDKYSATVGLADQTGTSDNYTHLDLTYAYNSNLSFTASKIVDDAEDPTALGNDDDLIFVVSYNLPIQ